ncbi:MAG: hypothetical protein ACOCUV_03695 [bacterium]
MDSVLLQKWITPYEAIPFDQIKEEEYFPALKEAIGIAKKRINDIKECKDLPNFKNTIETQETATEEVDTISTIFFNLLHAHGTDKMQEIAKEFSPLLSSFNNDIHLDEGKLMGV